MSLSIPQGSLTSLRHELDRHPAAFGNLETAIELVHQPQALQQRMQEAGYLYLPGLLDADQVWQARQEICDRLWAEGALDPDYAAIEAVAKPGVAMQFRPDLVAYSPTLKQLLYSGSMMQFYQQLLGGTVRHFDYTWLRAVAPGQGTYPHCDIVYMGRGSHNLYTSWVPLGDVSWDMGGLMILERSHRLDSIRNSYGRMDVDSYIPDRQTSGLYASGQKVWSGALSKNPVSLRQRYGGRWLTNEFKAGDVLVFGMFTIHASLDNHSQQIRLSSDSRYQLASEPIDERWVGDAPIGHSAAAKRVRNSIRR
ncbi:phytanoyl-CoA dioxygenase family protein [Phormidium tenue FACHB-886]|nr:phytanoyl-CoA dioxygenase family protein [Phormidium tenue FACHB-886]